MNLFWQLVKVAFISLMTHRLRSILAVLGVVIGVSSVIMMVAMGQGLNRKLTDVLTGMGTNLIFIEPQSKAAAYTFARTQTFQTLTVEDCHAIKKLPHVVAVSPQVMQVYQIKFMNKNMPARVLGCWPEYTTMREYLPKYGRFIIQQDIDSAARVCVLGSEVAKELFGNMPAKGRRIKIENSSFKVVGVMQEKGAEGGWIRPDSMVFIPVTTIQKKLLDIDYLHFVIARVDKAQNVDRVEKEIEKLLIKRHNIKPGQDPDFHTHKQTDWLNRMNEVTMAFTILLGGIACVSLLVGGVGIMNIMLVSVAERTREIGIRKAVGAKNSHIFLQFLVESIVISLGGGVIGIIIGIAGSFLVAYLPIWAQLTPGPPGREGAVWQPVIPVEIILIASIFAFCVGLFFGIYPALRASRLNPVEALRYE